MRDRPGQGLPDGLRVLVAGGHKVGRDSVLTFCRELGKALIGCKTNGTQVVVMTGGRGDDRAADREVVEGAREALGDENLVERVSHFPPPDAPTLSETLVGTHVQTTMGTDRPAGSRWRSQPTSC